MRFVIVVELHDVQLFRHAAVIHRVKGHGIRAHGHAHIAVQNFRLPVYKGDVRIILERAPGEQEMRVVPSVARGGDIGKIVVPLAEQVEIPGLVERVDMAKFLAQAFAEFRLAFRAEAAQVASVDFIVDLPANDGGILAKFARHGLHDAHAIGVVMRVVRAAMPAPAVLAAAAVLALHEHIRVQAAEPARRRGRGRAHNDTDARLAQLVHHFMEKRKIEFAIPGLHAVPGEFANARHIDANLPHAANIAIHLFLGPVFRIIRHAQIGRLYHPLHVFLLLSTLAFRRFSAVIVPRTRGKGKGHAQILLGKNGLCHCIGLIPHSLARSSWGQNVPMLGKFPAIFAYRVPIWGQKGLTSAAFPCIIARQ